MPRVTIYLPDDLYAAARSRGLSLSRLTQQAIRDAVWEAPNSAWIELVRTRQPRCATEIDTSELLEEVHEEFGR